METNGRLNIVLEDILTNQRDLAKKVDQVSKDLRQEIANSRVCLEGKIDSIRETAVTVKHCDEQHQQTAHAIAKADKLTLKNVLAVCAATTVIATGVASWDKLMDTVAGVAKAFGGP